MDILLPLSKLKESIMEVLKVGDRIYELKYGKIISISKVERLTKTSAVCDRGIKFRIGYNSSDWIILIGKASYNSSRYELETPELKEQLFRQVSFEKIRAFRFEDLPTDKINSILQILGIQK